MKIDRLIGIVMFLLTREKITAKELSDFYEVSERTIYRDFDALGKAGIPVVSLQGSGGGYGLAEGYTLSRQYLDNRDIESIVSSLQGLYKLSGDSNYTTAKNKIESMLSPYDRKKGLNFNSIIKFDFEPWGQDPGFFEKMNILYRAARECRVCSMSYFSTKGEELDREIEPHVIVFKEFAWYTIAFCRLRKEFRTFKVSRIQDIKLAPAGFSRKEAPQELSWSSFTSGKPEKITLVFEKKAKSRVEDNFDQSFVRYLEDGKLEVIIHTPIDDWIRGVILSYGSLVRVTEPKHLKNFIKTELLAAGSVYT